jgi:hypothetical protein
MAKKKAKNTKKKAAKKTRRQKPARQAPLAESAMLADAPTAVATTKSDADTFQEAYADQLKNLFTVFDNDHASDPSGA